MLPTKPSRLVFGAVIAAMCLVALSLPSSAFAQAGPNGLINPTRDCQTIRRCNFSRTGSFRGCISAYSCRTCQLVPMRCSIGNISSNCRRMRCDWGA
jgi:hypothetical protein